MILTLFKVDRGHTMIYADVLHMDAVKWLHEHEEFVPGPTTEESNSKKDLHYF
jgi:hypothetical protein